ncbi:MAG TPA: 3-oxoadipate enol-lactonase [Gaiellales bacterium]|nr:3-oxoadipate enol-lactonase [Gaiellales bacterium]
MNLAHRIEGPAGAPVLVLSNSLGSSIELWDQQMPALTAGHRVLRYDHRGHGGSDVPAGPYSIGGLAGDVLALLDRLGVDRCSFAGTSMGGAVGMWLAVNAPLRIDRLAVLCSSARFGTREMWLERAAVVRAGGIAEVAAAAVERWFTPTLRERRPELVDRFRRIIEATPAAGYAGCCEALAEWDFGDRLAEIEAPTLVVAGADDPSVPLQQARLIAGRVARSRLLVVPAAAHLAHVERADVVTPALLKHLDEEGT